MSAPHLDPEHLATMREDWKRWEEKDARRRAEERAERRGERRRELSAVPATLRKMHDDGNPDKPIYPRELAVSLARDYIHQHVPPDYRQIRQEAGAVIHRIAQQQPEADAAIKRDDLFRLLNNSMPAALRPALQEWLNQLNRFATAREVAAFYVGYAAGQQQTEHVSSSGNLPDRVTGKGSSTATTAALEDCQQRRRDAIRAASTESLRLTLEE